MSVMAPEYPTYQDWNAAKHVKTWEDFLGAYTAFDSAFTSQLDGIKTALAAAGEAATKAAANMKAAAWFKPLDQIPAEDCDVCRGGAELFCGCWIPL